MAIKHYVFSTIGMTFIYMMAPTHSQDANCVSILTLQNSFYAWFFKIIFNKLCTNNQECTTEFAACRGASPTITKKRLQFLW